MAEDALRTLIKSALREDEADRDVTSRALVPKAARGRAVVRAKQAGVVAGLLVARGVFRVVDPSVKFNQLVKDGARVAAGTEIARALGPMRSLLAAERTAVNFLQRMSGIATHTAEFVRAVKGTRAHILATRKTAPGLRACDLAAVRLGGGDVHRSSLADRVLVKANHLAAARSSGTAKSMFDVLITLARDKPGVPVGIEVVDLDQLRDALVSNVDVVLLDNFSVQRVEKAVRLRKEAFPAGRPGPALEASGGITLRNVLRYARTGVDRISIGALTHSSRALDISMTVVSA